MLKRTILLILLTTPCFSQTPKEATVRVYAYTDKLYPSYRGSGVLVSATQVITNWHVVAKRQEGKNSIQVRFSDGLRSWATVEFENKEKDVALLTIPSHPVFQPMEFGVDVEYGEDVDTYGYTYDYEFVRRTNRMWYRQTRKKVDVEGYFFAVTGKRRVPGDSGGPVVKNNKIVGIIRSIGSAREKTGTIRGITLCVRADAILELIGDKLETTLRIK